MTDLGPYPAYGDSGVTWLKALPEHWRIASVRRVARVFAGATPSRSEPSYWAHGSIPWLSSGDVNLRRITKASQFITEAGFAASSTQWIRPGSLVLALAGQGRTKGMVASVECSATCNQSLAVVEPRRGSADYRFLGFYLESRYLDIRGLVGDGLRDGLNLEHVRAIPIPLPPLAEQEAIAHFLDDAGHRIGRYVYVKQQLVALLNEQRQAIIHRIVTRGLDANARLKPSGVAWLGDVPEHWDVVRLGSLLRERGETNSAGAITDVLSLLRRRGVIPYDEKGNVGNKKSGDITRYKIVRPNDIVMNCMNVIIGSVGLSAHTGCLSPVYYVLVCRSDRDSPKYMNAVFQCGLFQQSLVRIGKGILAHRMRIPMELLKCELVPRPPSGEQRAIVQHLEHRMRDCDRAIQCTEREISLLQDYWTRLIADVVTGKVDVREAAAQLPDEINEAESLVDVQALADRDRADEEDESDAALDEDEE